MSWTGRIGNPLFVLHASGSLMSTTRYGIIELLPTAGGEPTSR